MADQEPNPQTGYIPAIQTPGETFRTGVTPESPGYADAFRPDHEQEWQEQVNLNSLNALVGFRTGYEGVGIRAIDEFQHRNEKKYTADQLNKMIPDMPVPFSDDLPLSVALNRAENIRRQNEMRAWMSRGPGLSGREQFTAGAMSGLDLANLATGLLFGGSTFIRTLIGNIGGNLLADIPTTYLQRREQQHVDYAETVYNSIAGGVLGTGIHYGIAGTLKGLGIAYKGVFGEGERITKGMSAEAKAQAIEAEIERRQNNIKGDSTPLVKTMADRVDGKVAPGATAPDMQPASENTSDNAYFSSGHPDSGESQHFGEDLGRGHYMTTNEQVAKNMSANPEGTSTGKVHSNQIGENTKLVDLESPVSEGVGVKILSAIEEKLGIKLQDIDGLTVKEALHAIYADSAHDHKYVNEVTSEVTKELGFDGYKYVETGSDGSTHDAVMLFDEAKAQRVAEVPTFKEDTPQINQDEAVRFNQDATADQSNIFHSEEARADIENQSARDLSIPAEEEPAIQNGLDAEKRLLSDPDLPDSVRDGIDQANEEFKKDLKDSGAFKELADCIGKKIT